MGEKIEGSLSGAGLKICILSTRWNEFIVERLASGAHAALTRHGVDAGAIDEVLVPGAYELAFAARKLTKSGRYDAVVALGCVIRGSTPHFDYVAGEDVVEERLPLRRQRRGELCNTEQNTR